jgi:hypothetical protein
MSNTGATRTHFVASLGLTLCTALVVPSGCASNVVPGTAGEEIGAHYYAARRDAQDCRVAPCGGYILARLNTPGAVYHVRSLDFSSAGFGAGTIRAIEEAPPGELVLYGSIGDTIAGMEADTFVVVSAYRGMPGIPVPPDGSFYVVQDREPPIECLVAPCDNEIAHQVETDERVAFTTVSVARASAVYVDQSWLADRVRHHGAVVAGNFRAGAREPDGLEKVLDVGQVFVELPDRGGPCLSPYILCAEPTQPVYTRDVDRCLVFQSCVEQHACPPALPRGHGHRRPPPRCAEGYTLSRWPAAGTCVDYACDPAFLAE